MKRYKYLDVARGIGLLLVIISHSCGLSRYLIYYYIQLFFVVSGYIYKEGRSYQENVAKKAKRLLIPYFGYSAILLAFYALTGRTFEETKASALGILYSRCCLYDTTTHTDNVYLFTIANGAMWYLTAFFVTSLVYHLVIDRCLKDKKFLVICMIVLTGITMLLADIPVLLPWSIDIACVGTIFMIVGTLLGRMEFFEKKWNLPLIAGTFVVYMILCTINPGLNMSIREYGKYGAFSVPFFILIGISGSMLCIWFGKLIQNLKIGSLMAYIGQNTIILLAFHLLGLEVFEMIAQRFMNVEGLSGIAFICYHAIRVTVSVCGCLVLGKIMDAIKGRVNRKRRA